MKAIIVLGRLGGRTLLASLALALCAGTLLKAGSVPVATHVDVLFGRVISPAELEVLDQQLGLDIEAVYGQAGLRSGAKAVGEEGVASSATSLGQLLFGVHSALDSSAERRLLLDQETCGRFVVGARVRADRVEGLFDELQGSRKVELHRPVRHSGLLVPQGSRLTLAELTTRLGTDDWGSECGF